MMMNRRKKLIAAAVCVLALTALLVLPARLLSLVRWASVLSFLNSRILPSA